MDLCGFPKAAYWIHQAQWIRSRPILHVIPHWNWTGSEDKPIKVMVATNAERIALFLNGKPAGKKPVDKYEMVTFDVPYQPGTLEARASNGGKEVARFAVETTGAPAAIRLIPDRDSMAGDGMMRSRLQCRSWMPKGVCAHGGSPSNFLGQRSCNHHRAQQWRPDQPRAEKGASTAPTVGWPGHCAE
jgi:beta-galactosidase